VSTRSSHNVLTTSVTCARLISFLFRAFSPSLRLCAISIAMYGALGSSSTIADRTAADLTCLALTVYHEARGEIEAGKIAVAHVVMNRARDERFPRAICEVVYQNAAAKSHACEFSWTCDAVSDQPMNTASWHDSVRIAQAVYWGQTTDPSNGAMWYHADYVIPAWAATLGAPQQLGRHLFYRAKDEAIVGTASAPKPALPARRPIVVGVMPANPAPRLPEAIASFLADLRITMLICVTDVRDRAVRINDEMFHQGDELMPGLVLASISSRAVVVRYQDRWFRFTL
jgi:N-acetylmuramoyl-L-alanine amidase